MDNLQQQVVEKAGRLLGKQLNDYKTSYDKNLLVPVERFYNRETYGIDDKNTGFVGYDIWHAYEVSFLTEKGLPTTAVGKIKIPADSPFFVESKSMKLYFYSFNMMRYGTTREEGIKIIEDIASKDLSEATKSNVEVKLFLKEDEIKVFDKAILIEDLIDINDIEFTVFNEDKNLIKIIDQPGEAFVTFNNLRSNCRVTHQPDFSALTIKYKGKKTLDLTSLLQFVVSFRNENHFHEEVVEMIYKYLSDKLDADELMVGALYTRRGGIDICPIRANKDYLLDSNLINIEKLTRKTINQ